MEAHSESMEATQNMDDETNFAVEGIACRVQNNFKVKVGFGSVGTKWPRKLQFMVALRTGEHAEQAVRRWLASERGLQHAAAASGDGEEATGPVRTPMQDSSEPTVMQADLPATQ